MLTFYKFDCVAKIFTIGLIIIRRRDNNNNNMKTIDHLISGCPTLAKNEYIIRHDKSSALLNMQEIRN
jgi:hypothetical protein